MPGELHGLLVQKAARWALRARGCTFALCEPPTPCLELPDVLAWQMRGYSVLVECKASRSDFLADRKKYSRRAPWEYGLGQERWYAVAPGVASADDIPDGWGLLVLTKAGRFQRVVAARSGGFDSDIMRREFGVLLMASRRWFKGAGPVPWLRFNLAADAEEAARRASGAEEGRRNV